MKLTKLTLLASLIAILSCSTKKSEKQSEEIVSIDSSELKNKISNEEKPIKNDTFYKAHGNEPGWRIVILEKKPDSLEFDLLLDYGEAKLNGIAELISSNDSLHVDSYRLKDGNNLVNMKVIKEKCEDEGEQIYSTSITLEYNENKYLGCGNYRGVK